MEERTLKITIDDDKNVKVENNGLSLIEMAQCLGYHTAQIAIRDDVEAAFDAEKQEDILSRLAEAMVREYLSSLGHYRIVNGMKQ